MAQQIIYHIATYNCPAIVPILFNERPIRIIVRAAQSAEHQLAILLRSKIDIEWALHRLRVDWNIDVGLEWWTSPAIKAILNARAYHFFDFGLSGHEIEPHTKLVNVLREHPMPRVQRINVLDYLINHWPNKFRLFEQQYWMFGDHRTFKKIYEDNIKGSMGSIEYLLDHDPECVPLERMRALNLPQIYPQCPLAPAIENFYLGTQWPLDMEAIKKIMPNMRYFALRGAGYVDFLNYLLDGQAINELITGNVVVQIFNMQKYYGAQYVNQFGHYRWLLRKWREMMASIPSGREDLRAEALSKLFVYNVPFITFEPNDEREYATFSRSFWASIGELDEWYTYNKIFGKPEWCNDRNIFITDIIFVHRGSIENYAQIYNDNGTKTWIDDNETNLKLNEGLYHKFAEQYCRELDLIGDY